MGAQDSCLLGNSGSAVIPCIMDRVPAQSSQSPFSPPNTPVKSFTTFFPVQTSYRVATFLIPPGSKRLGMSQNMTTVCYSEPRMRSRRPNGWASHSLVYPSTSAFNRLKMGRTLKFHTDLISKVSLTLLSWYEFLVTMKRGHQLLKCQADKQARSMCSSQRAYPDLLHGTVLAVTQNV